MRKPITKVELVGFRGATVALGLDFDPQKDMTMLFGENGSGKSTILDAIDVVCNETIGSLGGISVGRNATQYLCSLGTERTSLNVTVHSGDDSWIARLQGSSVDFSGNVDKPRVDIIRRNRILALVTAQPHERYNALKHFIDTAVVERSEENLRLKLREINERMNTLVERHTSQNDQLDEVWEREGRPGGFGTALEWASDKVSSGIGELSKNLADLNAVVTSITYALDSKRLFSNALSDLESSSSALEKANKKIADSPGIDPVTSVKLIDSLSKAKEYIDADIDLDHCPTCLRSMPRNDLIKIIDNQLSELGQLITLNKMKKSAEQRLEVAKARVNSSQKSLAENAIFLVETLEGKSIKAVDDLEISWPDWSQPAVDISLLQTILNKFESIKSGIIQNRDDIQKDVNQYNSIHQWHKEIIKAAEDLKDLDRISKGLKKCFDIVHQLRIDFVDGVLATITSEARRLFQVIHPGERINLSALKMDPSQRGSVLQSGEFHDHADIPPQAVFSDSHMDTLGFCVWLALAKLEKPSETVLLLDDIFTSVDNQHVQRIIDLLAVEAPNFLQVIVATHYRLWYDRCQNAQGIQRVPLGQWNVFNGIAVQDMPPIVDQLQLAVSSAMIDRQLISSKAGILLENVLSSLTIVYRRPVPATVNNQNTLGDLFDACRRLFSRHSLTIRQDTNWNVQNSSESWQEVDVSTPFERVGRLQFIRNQVGCHFSEPGTEIPDNEVKEFGEATVALVKGLICPSCGFVASKLNHDGTALRCKCPKKAVRMTPVVIS